MRLLTCNNSMAYLKNWTDNWFQIFFMGTSWVAVSINNITTRASREMTPQKNIKMFDFNGVNVAKHWPVAGEVFAISDCLVLCVCTHAKLACRFVFHVYHWHLTFRELWMGCYFCTRHCHWSDCDSTYPRGSNRRGKLEIYFWMMMNDEIGNILLNDV